MRARSILLVCAGIAVLASRSGMAQDREGPDAVPPSTGTIEMVRFQEQYSRVHLKVAQRDSQTGLAVLFQGTDDLHFYAKSETAPAEGFDLKVRVASEDAAFSEPLFPKWKPFYDAAQEKDIEVYVGDFEVFVPLGVGPLSGPVKVTVQITGLACTSSLCLPPFDKTLTATVDFDQGTVQELAEMEPQKTSEAPQAGALPATADSEVQAPRQAILPYSTGVYYLLAVLAGISINIMPCVLPVIPLILMRLIDQSKRASGNRIASGMAFCVGVILFFAAFALVSAIINLSTGAVLDLNSLFRYPAAVIVLFLAIVFFGLAMLDVITLSLPASVTGKQGTGSGIVGTAGMGFFAGVLSTPCSGALLGFVLVWAQTQALLVSSTAIVLMGVGMALPYAVIVLIPSLLDRIPKPGTWMEIFKKSAGFLLFLIAAKLTLAALPKDRLLNVLMYGIVFSFCVWMWGKWVGFSTPAGKKWTVRLIALAIAVGAGYWLLPATGLPAGEAVDWQDYDRDLLRQATAQERPVLLKFTADWCTNCKVVEKRVYHDPEVVERIKAKNMLPIKADTTLNNYPATVDLKQVYGEAGNVPVTIVVRPDGQREKLRGIFDKEELLDIIESLPGGQK